MADWLECWLGFGPFQGVLSQHANNPALFSVIATDRQLSKL